jgi:hypothetical protein
VGGSINQKNKKGMKQSIKRINRERDYKTEKTNRERDNQSKEFESIQLS